VTIDVSDIVGDLNSRLGELIVGERGIDIGHDLVFPVDLGERLGVAHLRQTVGVERVMQKELPVPIVEVLHDSQADLVQMTLAVDTPGRLTRLLHTGKQQSGQNRNDRHHDQELDQCETCP
jgi:hypothetical protein